MQGLMQDWPLRLHRIIDHAAEQFGSREIVSREPDGSLSRTTYAGLRGEALRIAERLRQDGLAPGDRVATLAWNSARHMAAWYGITGAGGVYHTVNPRLFPEQIAWIVNHGGARTILTDQCFLPLLEGLAGQLSGLRRVIVLDDGHPLPQSHLPQLVGFDAWLGDASDGGWTSVAETDAAGLCYTSGTTGDARGVLYSHRSQVLHALSVASPNSFAIAAEDVILPVVPMFHVNAWSLAFAAPMMGAELVMPGARLDGASLHELIEREGVTKAAGVPTIWMGLLDHMRRNDLRFSTLKHMFVGGSACPRVLIETFERQFGVEVCHAWGMTEMSPVGTSGRIKPGMATEGEPLYVRKAKQGYAPFGVEMRITDDEGETLPWDGERYGRLKVAGFAVTRRYFGDAEDNLDQDGFFDTGDVATIDPAGTMAIVDRTKDVIKSGGEWISSITIESLVAAHPDVAEAAVIAIAHEKWSERPLLVVVAREGAMPSAAALLDFLRPQVAKFWLPDGVEFVEALPHGPTGKVSKKSLRAMFGTYRFAPSPVSPEAPAG